MAAGGRAAGRLLCLLGAALPVLLAAAPAGAAELPVAAAAQAATGQGYRTAVATLDLATGAYSAAGEDTAAFPSESVVKVLIATELLLSGRMDGGTAATAERMVSASDDLAADSLYALAGGDAVVQRVAAHYGIADLGSPPPVPGRWGLTRITARGLVHLYAALAADPAVHPWLAAAMARATPVAADGTAQLFGLPAASPGAAVKQGWGHDGPGGTGNAVVLSTGWVDGGRRAVVIATSGPASTYGAAIQATVTAQARALLAAPAAPVAAPAPQAAAAPAAAPAPAVRTASPVSSRTAALAAAVVLPAAGAVGGGSRLLRRLRASRAEARDRHRRAPRRPGPPGSRLVRLPDGRVVCIALPSPGGTRPPVRVRAAAAA